MKNTTILEMINNGQIEQLKDLLTKEIYQDSLKGDSNAKKRYAAMKRYFKYEGSIDKDCCKRPCKDVEVDNKYYNSFVDGYCFALTTESIDTLETFDKTKGDYLDMQNFVNFSMSKSVEKIDLNAVLAEAKSKGYKYKKAELSGGDYQYVFKYRDDSYKLGLIDKAFSIINDGNPAEVYYNGKLSVLLFKTSIGIAGVMPMKSMKNINETKTVIKIEN